MATPKYDPVPDIILQDEIDAFRKELMAKLSPEDRRKLEVIEQCALKLIDEKIPFWLFAETKNHDNVPQYMQFNWCEGNEKTEMDDTVRANHLDKHLSALAWNAFSQMPRQLMRPNGSQITDPQEMMDLFIKHLQYHISTQPI